MEGTRRRLERPLKRSFQLNRLEEQLWIMAYEQVWPVIHRSLKRLSQQNQQEREGSRTASTIARRA
jgi:hypothetical protein